MAPLPSRTGTVVIGAGQAGLTMSWYLQRAGREHVVLERRAELGGGWRDRWDAFRLVGPNWTASFPDDPYDLTPGSFADVDPSLHEPGLVWGAAKAHVVLARRRREGRR